MHELLDAQLVQVFVIGGSYSGGTGDKTGEVYSSADSTWKLLPGADVAPILTNDLQGIYRADNHAWLWVSSLATHACLLVVSHTSYFIGHKS